jgi:hypothetical protein
MLWFVAGPDFSTAHYYCTGRFLTSRSNASLEKRGEGGNRGKVAVEAAAKKAAAAKADVERREAEAMHSAVIAEVYPRLSGAWTAPLQPL